MTTATTTTRTFTVTIGNYCGDIRVSQQNIEESDFFNHQESEETVATKVAYYRFIQKIYGKKAYWYGDFPKSGSARGQVMKSSKFGGSNAETGVVTLSVFAH